MNTGVMVALYPPEDIAQGLAIPDGEDPADLHLTLCYLGDSTELPADLQANLLNALSDLAAQCQPVQGQINGHIIFNPTPDSDNVRVYCASVDSPDLVQFRPQVADAVQQAGGQVASNHGYTPHITRAYVPDGQQIPFSDFDSMPCTFDNVSLVWGDNRTDIPLGSQPTNDIGENNMPAENSSDIIKALEAMVTKATANLHAKAGETIVGNLARGNDGKFTSAGNVSEAPIKSAAEVHALLRGGGGKGKGKGKKPAKEKKTPEQKTAEAKQKTLDNLSKVADGLAGGPYDLIGAAMSEMDLPNEINDANQAVKDDLVKNGLATKYEDGTYDLTGTGRAAVRAASRGDLKATQRILNTGTHVAASKQKKKAASAAKLRDKAAQLENTKETLTTQQRADLSKKYFVFPDEELFPVSTAAGVMDAVSSWGRYKGKHTFDEFKTNLTRIAKREGWPLPAKWQVQKEALDIAPSDTTFKVFKDAQGNDRWLLWSSSGFMDKDKQIATTKALEEDCARADLDKDYGPLLWHHQPELVLGDCDYNAVINNILVESGTFATPQIAKAFEQVPADQVGASLGFYSTIEDLQRNQFDWLRRFERSLLRQHKASNWLTRLFTVRRKEAMADKSKVPEKVMDLFNLLGADDTALEAVTSMVQKTQVAKEAAIKAGLVFKAAGDTAPVEGGPAEGDTTNPEEAAEEDSTVMEMSQADFEDMMNEMLSPLAKALQQLLGQGSAAAPVTKEVQDQITTSITAAVVKEVGTTLATVVKATTQLADQLNQISAVVKELAGDVPTGVLQGYRASTDPRNVIKKDANNQQQGAAAQPDAFDLLIGLNPEGLITQ